MSQSADRLWTVALLNKNTKTLKSYFLLISIIAMCWKTSFVNFDLSKQYYYLCEYCYIV